MKKVLITASVVVFSAVAGFMAPTVVTPQTVKSAIQETIGPDLQLAPQSVNRNSKGDRESLNFEDRWEAVKELDKQKYPALHQWMVEHGLIGEGAPAVAKGD
jgi:hypothetical protein